MMNRRAWPIRWTMLSFLAAGCGSDPQQPFAGEPAGNPGGNADASTSGSPDATTLSGPTVGTFGRDGAVTTNSPGPSCAGANVTFKRIVPTVWLMVDGSGSMAAGLQAAGPSRFEVLRDALMNGTSGLVFRLQSSVAFGLYLYDGCAYDPSIVGPGCPAGACPRSTVVDPALGNYGAISAHYPQAPPGTSTPTDVALGALGKHIGSNSSSAGASPRYVVLATDGEPNLCDWHDGIPSNPGFQQNAIDAVKAMVASGTEVFAISLAGSDTSLQAYLEQLAAAGGTGQHSFSPTTQDELASTLSNIVGGAVSCDVTLTGTVVSGQECNGQVKLNGTPLVCDGADGWRLKDAHTIELVGSSCSALRSDPAATLSASFPCDAYQPVQ
jgi:hypothetical protein